MTDLKISELPEITAPVSGDVVPIVSGGGTRRVTIENLKEFFSDYANVVDFGAVGDGVTDDSAAIQAAIDKAETDGLRVFVPAGTYLISTALSVPTGVEIVGEGRNNTIIRTSVNTIDAFDIESNARKVRIAYLDITSGAGVGASNAAINVAGVNGCAECVFEDLDINSFEFGFDTADLYWQNYHRNIRFQECDYGFNGNGTAGTSINNYFSHCYFQDCDTYSVFVTAFKGTHFNSCNFGHDGTTTSGPAIQFGTNCFGSIVQGCNFEAFTIGADLGIIRVLSATDLKLSSCEFPVNGPASGTAYYVRVENTARVTLDTCTELNPETNMDFIRLANDAQVFILDDSFNDATRINHASGSTATTKVYRGGVNKIVSPIIDLSGAAVDHVLCVPENAGRVVRIADVYTEASSADAGINIQIEAGDGSPGYLNETSRTSAAQWNVAEKTLSTTLINAGEPIVIKSAGSKTGAGEVQYVFEWVDDAI